MEAALAALGGAVPSLAPIFAGAAASECQYTGAAVVALGLLALALSALAALRLLLRLPMQLLATPDLPKLCGPGTWGCVTGATDGIGRAYALELARQGMPVLLLSRTESKLEATAAEVREPN